MGKFHATVTVYGKPVPQGSKQAQVIYDMVGKPVMKDGRVITVVRNVNSDLRNWRNQVAAAVLDEYQQHTSDTDSDEPPLMQGPVGLRIVFLRPRPKGHYGTGRNAGKLKASAPEWPTARPDTLKLARAVEDALTGVIWQDDSQVVAHDLAKRWGERFSTIITISEL